MMKYIDRDRVRYRPFVRLTKRQREVLTILASGEELVYSYGGGYWIGLEKTNGKLVKSLLRSFALRAEELGTLTEYYNINSTGLLCLEYNALFIVKPFMQLRDL